MAMIEDIVREETEFLDKEEQTFSASAQELSPEKFRDYNVALETTNIVDDYDDETLDEIGKTVVSWYDEDRNSRYEWERDTEKWLKLATQVMEQKSYPWRKASNVKYPLVSTAAMQFHARAYSALITDERPVKTRVVGEDKDGNLRKSAENVSAHMSYQVLQEMEDWQEEFDRLLYVLPIIGLVYRKSYYSPIKKTNVSELCLPDDVVVNYFAKDFTRATKTHYIPMTGNEIVELQNVGYFRKDVDLQAPTNKPHPGAEDAIVGLSAPARGGMPLPEDGEESETNDVPFEILESHTWWDLDGDGYQEPYTITVDYATQQVLRITARWRYEDMEYDSDGNIVFIRPNERFTQYGFLPNPESKIYYQGFGQLLGPLNAAANTIMNQLIDAGTLANMPGGFLGRGMRLRGGQIELSPGKWQHIPVQGDDIRKNVFPLPYKEPSSVLFQLLGLVLESGERLSSVNDMMLGENPGQNQPYATSVMVLEQGLKVFSGIYRRIYRALTKEYKKLYELNKLYLDQDKSFALVGDESLHKAYISDYLTPDIDIVPGADPNIVSEAHRIMRANSLLQKMASGLPLNVEQVTKAVLEAEGHDNIEELMQPNPPQKDPQVAVKEAEIQSNERIRMLELQLEAQRNEYEAFRDFAGALANLAKAEATASGQQQEEMKTLAEVAINDYKALTERMKATADIQATQQQPEQAAKQEQDKVNPKSPKEEGANKDDRNRESV